MSTTDNWGSLEHFLPKLDPSAILQKIQEKQQFYHSSLVSPIERLPSYRKDTKDKPSRQHAGSSYMLSPSPPMNLRSPLSESQDEKNREKGNRSSFGVYSQHHRLGSSPPKSRGRFDSLKITPPELPSPKYSSRRTTHSHTMNLKTVRQMYSKKGPLIDDSANYIYKSHKLKKNKIVKIIDKQQKLQGRVHSILDAGLDEMNDSLMQTDLMRQKEGSPPPISERITELGGKTMNIASTISRRSPVPISDRTTPDLVEPKLLREIREARKNEELEEQDRKIGVLPLRFHMIKALNKVKKAGAVAQERAKFSTNNMQRLKLELLQNRERFGYRQNYYQNAELDSRLEDLHRGQKLKQSKLDKKAKDDGTGTFVPYITAKMIAAAEREASTVQMQVKQRDREEWMKKRKLKGRHQYAVNRERVQFAKSIFTTWDTNKNGRLDVHEIADPMISLGLSNTFSFVEQVIGSMKVQKKRQGMLSQILKNSQRRGISQESEIRASQRLITEKTVDPATDKMSMSYDKMDEIKKVYQERQATLREGVKSGIGRKRGVRKVNESQKLYGLKGLGSKEGDVLTVKAFVQLFKTDKVSESIMRIVRKDYVEKLKREWEKKQIPSTMASRIASPATFAARKISSPLRLELQTTKEQLSEKNSIKPTRTNNSPLPGVEAFFAVSGHTYESEVVSASASRGRLPIHIDAEHRDYQPSDQRYITQSSMNFGVPEPPDTTVFSFTGMDVNLSPEQSKQLSSLLNNNQKKELKKVRASIRASLKRIEVETQSMVEVAEEIKNTGSKSVRPTSTFKTPRSGSQDHREGSLQGLRDDLKQNLRVKAMKNMNEKSSIPSAQVEPANQFLFGSGDLPDATQIPLPEIIPVSHHISSIGSSGKIPNFQDQHPSLAEQLEIVKEWWTEIQKICRMRRNRGESGGSDQILPVVQIVEYLVDRKIVPSRDLADRLFKKMLGLDLSNISFLRLNDFTNLFTRSLFRECILHAAREIEKHQTQMLSKSIKKDTASRKASGLTLQPSTLSESPRRKQYQNSEPAFGSKKERFEYKHEYKQKTTKQEDKREPVFSMDMKMSSYQRSVMFDGLFRGTKFHKLGKEVLDALVTFHNPSEEESSVYNIIRLIGELTGEDEIMYQEEEDTLLPLLEGWEDDEDELNWLNSETRNLETLQEQSIISESHMSRQSLRLGEVVVPSAKQLKLCDWRKGGDIDAGKKPLQDELDKAIEQEFDDEETRQKMVPHRYKDMTVRQRRLADKQLIKQIQEFYTKPDPLQVAKQMEHKAEEGLFF